MSVSRGSARRPRLAHLIKGLGRGGAEALLPPTLAASAARYEHRVGYFLPHKDALVREVEAAGADVRCFGAASAPAMLLAVPRVARWLRRDGADLVHAHLPLAGVVARLAARLAGVPVVYTEHNLQERYHPATRRANALTWRLQRRAVAVSGEVAASIRSHLGSRVPVTVVHNGIALRPPAAEAVAAARRELDLADGGPVVGTVAVMRPQKRLDLWLRAARRIHDELPEARFLVVGDGPLRGELEATAGELGLAGTVRFTGLREDVPTLLALMDVYLMTSRFEGLPLALLEAMAAGVAAVATPVGGIPEVIDDGVHGRLTPFGEPAAAATAVLALLADPSARSDLAASGRRRVEREFSVERMVRDLEAVYREVLDER